MIDSLKLVNFKCFNQAVIEMNRLTVFTGANASGKSTVIQALILANHSNRIGQNDRGTEMSGLIDINSVFGFSVGAPNALVSQNPVDESGDYDFVLMLEENGKAYRFDYKIDKNAPLDLKVYIDALMPGYKMQYLNAERIGPRVSNQAGRSENMAFNGENAVYMIDVADRTERPVADVLKEGLTESNKFSYFVENWMSAILGDLQLDIHTDYNKAITELRVKNSLVDHSVVPTLTGFGISYVLPIVVAGLWASMERDSMLIFENPEAHLHPYAQSNMGKFLALLAASGVQVIVETHSEHIIDGIRYQMAYLDIAEQCTVNFMENTEDCVQIKAIKVSSKGELSSWPKGFFDQKQKDLRDILGLRKRNVKC